MCLCHGKHVKRSVMTSLLIDSIMGSGDSSNINVLCNKVRMVRSKILRELSKYREESYVYELCTSQVVLDAKDINKECTRQFFK